MRFNVCMTANRDTNAISIHWRTKADRATISHVVGLKKEQETINFGVIPVCVIKCRLLRNPAPAKTRQ